MTRDQLDELTQRYLNQSFDEIEQRLALEWSAGGLEEHAFQLNDRCYELTHALSTADLKSTLPLAQELAPDADEPTQRVLARRLLEVRLRAAVAELQAAEGAPLARPAPSTAWQPPEVAAKVTPRLSEVARMYGEERVSLGRWSPKTAFQGTKIFDVIVSLLGDPPVGEVGKGHIRQLGLDIAKLPANMAKRFPGLTAAEVLARADSTKRTRLEPRSVNKYYQHVRTLFGWAVEHDFLIQNPAAVLHDVEEGRAQDARKVFDDADIVALFAQIELKAKEPYGVWVPRIMAYTGCRMGEAAQLRKEDVRMEQGVWVFALTDEGDGQSLKTDGSKRSVPVHPRLIELGLLDFADSSPDDFLFPERIRHTESETRGNVDLLSKQLNRWLRQAGVTDKRKSLQSLRGTFVTRLKDMGAHEHQIAEIVGHENDNITTGRYGKRTKLPVLHEVLARLTLPI